MVKLKCLNLYQWCCVSSTKYSKLNAWLRKLSWCSYNHKPITTHVQQPNFKTGISSEQCTLRIIQNTNTIIFHPPQKFKQNCINDAIAFILRLNLPSEKQATFIHVPLKVLLPYSKTNKTPMNSNSNGTSFSHKNRSMRLWVLNQLGA